MPEPQQEQRGERAGRDVAQEADLRLEERLGRAEAADEHAEHDADGHADRVADADPPGAGRRGRPAGRPSATARARRARSPPAWGRGSRRRPWRPTPAASHRGARRRRPRRAPAAATAGCRPAGGAGRPGAGRGPGGGQRRRRPRGRRASPRPVTVARPGHPAVPVDVVLGEARVEEAVERGLLLGEARLDTRNGLMSRAVKSSDVVSSPSSKAASAVVDGEERGALGEATRTPRWRARRRRPGSASASSGLSSM